MKRLLLIFIFISVFSLSFSESTTKGPIQGRKVVLKVIVDQKQPISVFEIDKEVIKLKNNGFYIGKDIKTLDSITYNILNSVISDSISNTFNLTREDFISCIQAIAISEGSIVTKRGSRAFQSSLFIINNNPFGIKGKGLNVTTVEYYNNKRYVVKQNFKYYNSFEVAIHDLMRILSLLRYKKVKQATNITEFFYALKAGGYLTAPTYHKTFFIPYSKKLRMLS